MRFQFLGVIAAAASLAVASVGPQARPDVNGAWVRDDGRTSQALRDQQARIAAGGDQFWNTQPRADQVELKLDAETLTLTASRGPGPAQLTWRLDGTPHANSNGVTTTARLRGQRIEVEQKLGSQPAQLTEFFRDGAWLVIRDSQVQQSPPGSQPSWRSRTTYYARR